MTGPGGDRRPAALAREAGRLRGNRIWRVETPSGPALQKFYSEKAGPLRTAWRGLLSGVLRGATSSAAAVRWRTERELLALWAGAGLDVPRDLTASCPALAGDRVLVMEFVEGKVLGRMLHGGDLAGPARAALLARFAAAWGRRHRLAVDRNDPRLVQVHGTLMHVLVAGDRLVTIDLEQAYLAGQPVPPLLAREVLSYLRSLAKAGDGETFRRDLAVLVAAYPERAILRGVVEDLRRSRSGLRGILWSLDGAAGGDGGSPSGKGAVTDALEAAVKTAG